MNSRQHVWSEIVMTTFHLSPGTVCIANGRVIQIDGPDSLTHMLARDVATGSMMSIAITEIEALPRTIPSVNAVFISASEWEYCATLARDLNLLNDRRQVSRDELKTLAARYKMSPRQMQRVRAAYMKDPRASTLARKRGGRPPGTNKLDPKVDEVIRHAIAKHYLRREKPPKAYVVLRTQSMARRLGLAPPSRKAVFSRLNREIGWQSDLAREGSHKAGQKWDARPGRLTVTKPLELIQIDHTRADVVILTDDRLGVLGRPWVTVAIDVATRCVLGMYVSMHAPSCISVSLCIEHAVLPKLENESDPGIWPMYGKPSRILVDNGKDFRSIALQRGCEEHGIELSWRPIRTPHYGAHVERLIGTLMKIAHLLPGTTFSNIKERGDYDSEGKAQLTLGEFRDWMTQKVCRFYHQRKHRALGLPPVVAWERSLTNEIGDFIAPPLIARPLDFRLDFLPFAMRRIRRTGVELNASRYWHPELAPMLNSDSSVMVRYNPRDPSAVWIKRTDGVLVKAGVIGGRVLDATHAAASMHEETTAGPNAEIDKGFEMTDAIEAQAIRSTRRARRTFGRRRNAGHDSECSGKSSPIPSIALPNAKAIRIEEWD